jgi:hypothetical protein
MAVQQKSEDLDTQLQYQWREPSTKDQLSLFRAVGDQTKMTEIGKDYNL